MFFAKEKEPAKSGGFQEFHQQLTVLPIPNEMAKVVESTEGRLSLEVPLRYSPWMQRFAHFFKLRKTRTYILEGLSLEVYRCLDGTTTVGDLIEAFIGAHKLTFFESRGLIVQYLHGLIEKGLIVGAVPKDVSKADGLDETDEEPGNAPSPSQTPN